MNLCTVHVSLSLSDDDNIFGIKFTAISVLLIWFFGCFRFVFIIPFWFSPKVHFTSVHFVSFTRASRALIKYNRRIDWSALISIRTCGDPVLFLLLYGWLFVGQIENHVQIESENRIETLKWVCGHWIKEWQITNEKAFEAKCQRRWKKLNGFNFAHGLFLLSYFAETATDTNNYSGANLFLSIYFSSLFLYHFF